MARIVHAVVLSAAAAPCRPRNLPPVDIVIAADAGLHVALALDWPVDVIVGDLDSVRPEALARATERGARIEAHPRDKDATDLELALDAARAEGATHVTVLDGRAGRLDHLLATMLLLAHPRYAGLDVHAYVDDAFVTVVPAAAARELAGEPGDFVTLLAVGGPARGVHTKGLRFALDGDDLDAVTTRGVSNELVAPHASVSIESGSLLVVQPGREMAR